MQKFQIPTIPTPIDKMEAKRKEATSLSFIGDAVHTLAVRSRLVLSQDVKTGVLHHLASKEVNATSQAIALKRIEGVLTEDETDVYKRCRNTRQTTMAKHASAVDYKIASGFEGLIGYLYFTGQSERIAELLELAYNTED
ncbi:MAG: Mini-ribonuclease 3 [Clostridia bacterium]|nr:Mini-ribonuclease 3 [Clostridia bacterium]